MAVLRLEKTAVPDPNRYPDIGGALVRVVSNEAPKWPELDKGFHQIGFTTKSDFLYHKDDLDDPFLRQPACCLWQDLFVSIEADAVQTLVATHDAAADGGELPVRMGVSSADGVCMTTEAMTLKVRVCKHVAIPDGLPDIPGRSQTITSHRTRSSYATRETAASRWARGTLRCEIRPASWQSR